MQLYTKTKLLHSVLFYDLFCDVDKTVWDENTYDNIIFCFESIMKRSNWFENLFKICKTLSKAFFERFLNAAKLSLCSEVVFQRHFGCCCSKTKHIILIEKVKPHARCPAFILKALHYLFLQTFKQNLKILSPFNVVLGIFLNRDMYFE